MNQAEKDVLAERQRQIDVEGWTPEHDDLHSNGELADAAECYYIGEVGDMPNIWPWDDHWWKPKSRRENYVRAAALYLAESDRFKRKAEKVTAEIERLDRQENP